MKIDIKNIDLGKLKNLKAEDIKQYLLGVADKKTLIKYGIGFSAFLIFLIGYYTIVNPIVKVKKEQIVIMEERQAKIEEWKSGQYSNQEISNILNNLKKEELTPGKVFHVKPCMIHRIEAVTDLILLETSTIELDDVIRINDEWGRQDGKIKKEHESAAKVMETEGLEGEKS